MNKIILITGARRSGKDSLYILLSKLNSNFRRWAFADELKYDLRGLIETQFGFDILNCMEKEKELVRPLLISYGEIWRSIDPLHWVKKVDIMLTYDKNHIIVDNRYCNEINYFKEKYKDVLVVEVIRTGGPEPTNEEKKNIPLIKSLVDYTIEWPTVGSDINLLMPYAEKLYKKINMSMTTPRQKQLRNTLTSKAK